MYTSFFGSELWRLDNTNINEIYTAWRKVVRRIWSIPYNTHSRFLPLLCNCLPIDDQFCQRFLNFIRRCLSDDSSHLVRAIVLHSLMFARSQSPIGYNFLYCMRRYCFDFFDFCNCNYFIIKPHSVKSADISIVDLLRELVHLRDGSLTFSEHSFLNYSDISYILQYISTS